MAISFDSGSQTTSTFQTSWTHTCDASATFLFVALNLFSGTPAVTYNSVPMTAGPSTGTLKTFYLFNPASGANTVSVTGGSPTDSVAASYIGTSTSALDASGTTTQSGAAGSHTASITTTVDNCWAVMAFALDTTSTLNAGTATTQRAWANQARAIAIFDSDTPKTPAGSVTLALTVGSAGSSGRWAKISIAPEVSTSSNSGFLAIL